MFCIIVGIFVLLVVLVVTSIIVGDNFIEKALVREKPNKRECDSDLFYLSVEAFKNYNKYKSETEKWLKKVKHEKININSCNLKLVAYQFRNNSHNWVILLHGYKGKKEEMLHLAEWYYNNGYNVLVPDLRGHGESACKYIGMGYMDRIDMLNFISYIINRDKDAKIVLHGHSMGAAAALFTTGMNPTNVVACIADCSYTSILGIFKRQMRCLFGLPSFPILNMANFSFMLKKDSYNLRKASVVKFVKNSKIPTLFINGSKDNMIPLEEIDTLYNTLESDKEKIVFEGVGHAQCELEDFDKYAKVVTKFLKKYIKNSKEVKKK